MRGGPGGCGSGRGSESPPLNGHAPTQDKHRFPIILGPSNSSHPAHSPSSVLLPATSSIASGPAPPPRLCSSGCCLTNGSHSSSSPTFIPRSHSSPSPTPRPFSWVPPYVRPQSGHRTQTPAVCPRTVKSKQFWPRAQVGYLERWVSSASLSLARISDHAPSADLTQEPSPLLGGHAL